MSDTLLGVIIGGVIATAAPIVVEVLRGRRQATLDTEKRADIRRIDRDAFQRVTLIDLMDAVADWKGVMTKVFYDQLTAYHQGDGPWPMTWSDENNARMETAQTRVIVLRERIIEDNVRSAIRETTDLRLPLLTASSSVDAVKAYPRLAEGVNESIEAIGAALRALSND